MALGPSLHDADAVRMLAVIAESGSISGAARTLGLSQPTVSRRLAALEAALGQSLVVRHGRGVVLSPAGDELRDAAAEVARALARFELVAAAQGRSIGGQVRVSASDAVATELLPFWAAELRAAQPGIQIVVAAENRSSDVAHHEADIAVRMYRPDASELVGVRIGPTGFSLYASRDYLARRGVPTGLNASNEHDLIGFDRDPRLTAGFRAAVGALPAERVSFGSDSHGAYLAAIRAGLGIGAVQTIIAARYPELVAVLPEVPLPPLDVWLLTTRDLKRSRLVDAVFASLRDWLGRTLQPQSRGAHEAFKA